MFGGLGEDGGMKGEERERERKIRKRGRSERERKERCGGGLG